MRGAVRPPATNAWGVEGEMSLQTAWEDFECLSGHVEFIGAQLATGLKNSLDALEARYLAVVGDVERSANVVALADTHYKWTSAALVAEIQKLLALRDSLAAAGFIAS